MKQIRRKLYLAVLMVIMVLSLTTTAFAAKKSKTVVTDIDTITELSVDMTQAAQIPLEGWYSKTLDSGRTVKMYVPTYASCRAYFTVVTVPNGVKDATAWADTMGFTSNIAKRGEVLVILEPQNKKWGKLADEVEYITEAMNFVAGGKNANGLVLFSNYSTYYLAGFGEGAAPLEGWSAANPILVGSQVFVGGKSAGKSYLQEVGSEIYDGTNTGGYDPGIDDIELFTEIMAEHGYTDGPITKSEVAVPTWFINYKSNDYSIKYWKSANACVAKYTGNALNRTYWQDINSDAFQTEYANSCTDENHGISQVKVSFSFNATAAKLGNFLYKYSRYNIPFAYSNHISERQDYTSIRVASQKAAQSAEYCTDKQYMAYDEPITSDAGTVYDGYYLLSRKQGKVGEGTVEIGVFASSDDDGDGTLDAHEYLLYIPDSAKGTTAPVVMQFPGNTQSISVGFDSTQWWRVANDEGVIIVIVGETYQSTGSAALTHKNADMSYYTIMDILANKIDGKKVNIDWERIYGSGHSAGSATVQNFIHTHPEFFAAVASTSFCSRVEGGEYEAVPDMLIDGQADLPFLMDNLWTSDMLKTWFGYMAEANDLKVTEATTDNCDAKVEGEARTWTYTWNNKQEIPMLVWGQTYLREHNCYPAEIPMAWDFLKNYKKTADGDRIYSPSGFEKDDQVVIQAQPKATTDDIESIQAYTDDTYYGTGVVQIVVTYKEGVDISDLTADDYIIEDRGSLNPDFGQIEISAITIKDQTVTIDIAANETAATENNAFIYSGDEKTGSRERNAFGIYCTGSWYRDENGVIHYGSSDNDEYENNTTGMGYQARESLELKLRHKNEAEDAAECLANALGQYNADGKWLETVDRQFTVDGFQSLYDLMIPSTANNEAITDGTGDAYVRGYYYIPENYDPANGIVFTLQGNGISYWKIADGCDNDGCGLFYDSATTSWANKGAIVVNIHDRSGFGKGEYSDYYDFVEDDVRVMKYFIETYGVTGNIVLQGNSRGTSASSSVIQALAGIPYKKNGSGDLVSLDKETYNFMIDTFICQNGMLGRGIWSEDDYLTIVKTGMKAWVFDGEQDTNNIDTVTLYTEAAQKAGYSEEWIAENIRHTCYPSEIYAYWGESDHSTTRTNGWYFADDLYYGPDLEIVDGEIVYNTKLNPGDTYTVLARGASRDGGMEKTDHVYTVYGENYQQWALADDSLDVEVSALTLPGDFGQKLKAVMIKYNGIVDESSLSADNFEIRNYANNITGQFANATITRIYTNNEPALLDEGSVAGQYVIIETDDLDKVGLVADTYYYKKADGTTGSISVRKDLNECYYLSVEQKQDVCAQDGAVLSAAKKAPINIDQANIDHDVLDEFQYLHLTDEEANEVLAGFTFANNNNAYSLSSNTTNFDMFNLSEDELLGDLNEATLAGLGVNIWYQLPDNYDPNKTYPLFLYAHGTGECLTFATAGDGTEYSNFGVHFNIGKVTGVWATTEDYGYEDCIVVAPQYYSGNSPRSDGYERDDAFRVALCYALANFSVDRDRVYVSGTSQGAGRTTALVRDCAEYITAAIVQNGGYSSKLSASTDLDALAQHKAIFQYATDNNVAIWFFQGVNDFISKPITAEMMYNAMVDNYKEAGKSDAWLSKYARFTYLNNKIYTDMNETSYHSTMKPTYRWYAFYNDDLYNAMYSDAEDSLGEYYDTKYGNNDPDGYAGLIDWALSLRKSEISAPAEEDVVDAAIESIQATTDMCFYGQKLTSVKITFAEGTDMDTIDAGKFNVYDRGSANPAFAAAEIVGISKEGNSITLKITEDTEATGERSRNSIGNYTTAAWYIDVNGDIHYGSADGTEADPVTGKAFVANTTGKGYVTRKNLDLVLTYGDQSVANGLKMTDGIGNFNEDGKWLPAIDNDVTAFTTEYVNVNDIVSANIGETYVAGRYEAFDGAIPVVVYAPEDYATKSYPMAVYVCGGGTSYWELYDEDGNVVANNPGTNLYFDAACTNWLDEDVIIISPQVHSDDNTNCAHEVAAVVQYYGELLNADMDQIIMIGNSNGAALLSETIRMYPGLCDVFFPTNGDLGSNDVPEGQTVADRDTLYWWTEEEIQAMAESGMAVWFNIGETDTRHILACQETYEKIIPYYQAAGFSDEWIADNIRTSAYMSWQYKYWGESDHSSTRLVWSNYTDTNYTNVYKDQAPLAVGDTYTLTGQEDFDYLGAENFEYKVYAEGLHEWALSRK